MELERLTLESFRNYRAAEAAFHSGVNLIVGDNAQGKTNLLEAIRLLSTGRSFRTRREQELISFGAPFAQLEGDLRGRDREQTVKLQFFSGKRPRALYIGGVRQRTASELSGLLTSVLFCPEDLQILKAGAALRRRFLDAALCQLRPGYARALSDYNRLCEGKAKLLQARFEKPAMLELLPDYSLRMAQLGASIIRYRAQYLEGISRESARYHDAFSQGREALTIAYHTVSTVENPLAPREEILQRLQEHQAAHARAELESGQCLSGPHRDDFEVTLGGLPVRTYGSQGQTRTCAISLKLAERELMRRDIGEEPLLLLDDVLSELDPARQDFVLNQIETGQVFITCCEKEKLTKIGRVFRIEGGEILPG